MLIVLLFGGFAAAMILASALRHAFGCIAPAALAAVLADARPTVGVPTVGVPTAGAAERAESAVASRLWTGSITDLEYRRTLEQLAATEPQPIQLGRFIG